MHLSGSIYFLFYGVPDHGGRMCRILSGFAKTTSSWDLLTLTFAPAATLQIIIRELEITLTSMNIYDILYVYLQFFNSDITSTWT